MANSLNQDIEGKRVIVKEECGPAKDDDVFVCEGGFGCSSFTSGRAVFGYFEKSGLKGRIDGYDIEKLADQ